MLDAHTIGKRLEKELAPLIVKCDRSMTDKFELYFHNNNERSPMIDLHFQYVDDRSPDYTYVTKIFVLPRKFGEQWDDAMDEVKAWLTLRAAGNRNPPKVSLEDISRAADILDKHNVPQKDRILAYIDTYGKTQMSKL